MYAWYLYFFNIINIKECPQQQKKLSGKGETLIVWETTQAKDKSNTQKTKRPNIIYENVYKYSS